MNHSSAAAIYHAIKPNRVQVLFYDSNQPYTYWTFTTPALTDHPQDSGILVGTASYRPSGGTVLRHMPYDPHHQPRSRACHAWAFPSGDPNALASLMRHEHNVAHTLAHRYTPPPQPAPLTRLQRFAHWLDTVTAWAQPSSPSNKDITQ